MNVLSVGAGSLAHGVHYAVLVIGLLGLGVLLGPQLVGGRRLQPPRDEHEGRVAELHRQIASGSLGVATVAPPLVFSTVRRATGAALLPIAVISSTAASGVHAAMGPAHFRELPLFGLFFAFSAIAQILWSVAVVLTPSRRLLLVGLVGNAAVVALWAATRTVGLPLGLMPTPEALGPWDLACAGWEIAVVVACVRMLRLGRAVDLRLSSFDFWPRSACAWMIASSVLLGALTVSGAGA
ncbi:hypothetical protein ABIE44_002084 [Marmoricola sp. OAE513]|uniref:hypothetical protein n=1 Tax=Marmoricola sp. OAE513 TaxID=2817894 RepID=UPI001AE36D50